MNKRPLSAASSLSECSPPNGILKSPASLSFRGAEGDEESRKSFVSRARFLASLGMTAITNVFQHPARSRRVRTWALMVALCGLLFCLPPAQAQEDQQKNPYQSELGQLHAMFAQTLPDWKAHQDNLAHGEDPSLNDADWSPFRISEPWQNGPVWFRRWVEIPQSMGGYNIRGLRVRLDLRVSAEGSSQVRVFFNGALAEMADEDTQQPILLTEKAEPGEKVLVAINVPAATASARLENAALVVDYPPGRPEPALMFEEIRSAQALIAGLSAGQPERAKQLDDAVKTLDFASLQHGDQQAFEKSLEAAQEKLQPLGNWAKQFSVRAVANSHIDMAWLWPWTETVEVVRNTFGTVLQLMRQYPGFIYAQSAAQDYVWMERSIPTYSRRFSNG